jgi:hypothetical protein
MLHRDVRTSSSERNPIRNLGSDGTGNAIQNPACKGSEVLLLGIKVHLHSIVFLPHYMHLRANIGDEDKVGYTLDCDKTVCVHVLCQFHQKTTS